MNTDFKISDYMGTGEESAVISTRIEETAGVNHRTFLKMVERERCAGIPICATNDGYFIARYREDTERQAASLRKRARSLFKARQGVMDAGKLLPSREDQEGAE